MKANLLFAAVSLCATCIAAASAGDLFGDVVYLRLVGSALAGSPRYELLRDRPIAPGRDVICVPARTIDGLELTRAVGRGAGTIYVTRTSLPSLPERYEVRELPRGVSYLQSVGGMSAPSPRRLPAQPPAAAATATRSAAFPIFAPWPATPYNARPRPFGWPPYDNPLERPPRR